MGWDVLAAFDNPVNFPCLTRLAGIFRAKQTYILLADAVAPCVTDSPGAPFTSMD